MDNWIGYVIAGFALVYVANAYMSLFGLIRQDIVKDKTEIKIMEITSEKAKILESYCIFSISAIHRVAGEQGIFT